MVPALLSAFQRLAARRMFARWSPRYEVEVSENKYSAADRTARAAIPLLAQHKKRPLIADVGIGTGLLAQQIFDAIPSHIIGLDFTEDMLAVCAGRDITELLIKCDAGRDPWPLESGKSDMVVSSGLAEYLTPEMLQHFLAESARVLQQNAALVFTYMPSNADSTSIKLWRGHSGTYLVCGYSPDYIEGALARNGLTLLQHSDPFAGCVFRDGSSYDYRLIAAKKG